MALTTLVLLLTVSYLYYRFRIDDKKITWGVLVIYFAASFVGGFVYGKIKEKNKFLYGIGVGLLYFAVLFLVSVVVRHNGIVLNGQAVYAVLGCMFGGMAGGMLA